MFDEKQEQDDRYAQRDYGSVVESDQPREENPLIEDTDYYEPDHPYPDQPAEIDLNHIGKYVGNQVSGCLFATIFGVLKIFSGLFLAGSTIILFSFILSVAYEPVVKMHTICKTNPDDNTCKSFSLTDTDSWGLVSCYVVAGEGKQTFNYSPNLPLLLQMIPVLRDHMKSEGDSPARINATLCSDITQTPTYCESLSVKPGMLIPWHCAQQFEYDFELYTPVKRTR